MKRSLGCIAGALVMVATLGGGQAVAGRTASAFDSANDASPGIDMKGVVVERLAGAKIQVRTQFSDFGPRLNGLELFFDVLPANRGPEYFAQVFRGRDGDGIKGIRMYRVDNWSGNGVRVACSWRYRWQYRASGVGFYTVTLAPNCFQGTSRHHRVKTHVNSWNYTRYEVRKGVKYPTFGYLDTIGPRHSATAGV